MTKLCNRRLWRYKHRLMHPYTGKALTYRPHRRKV